MYGIRRGYIHRKTVAPFDDTIFEDEYQRQVYIYGKKQMEGNGYSSVLDIGCGSAFKLIKYFKQYKVCGIEIEPTYTWLKTTYPEFHFYTPDHTIEEEIDLIVCSDVIEHVENPDDFINNIKKRKFKKIIFSTPERDCSRGKYDMGPPKNGHHFREWTFTEFNNFMCKHFRIEDHVLIDEGECTQLILASKL